MKNTKTKSALITSALAMLICVAMLVGTTFAWFTDTASTGVNKIQAGNLDIEFEYWNSTENAYQPITADTLLFPEDSKWEPGHTEVAYVKVSNAGNLALKYNMTVFDYWSNMYKNVSNKLVSLKDFINIAVIDGVDAAQGTYDRAGAIAAAEAGGTTALVDQFSKTGTILPNGDDQYFAIVAYMPETVGNEANPQTSSNPYIRFALQIVATQVAHENDSFGNTYDDGLAFPAMSIDMTGMTENEISNYHDKVRGAVNNALKTGNAMLGMDISCHYGLSLNEDIEATLDMNGNTFAITEQSQLACVSVDNGTLTIKGDGTFDGSKNERTTSINYGGQAVYVSRKGSVIIESGTFIGKDGRSCIYTIGGAITIKGGFFMIKDATTTPVFVVNKLDNCGANVQIMGGTFVNFNPADTNTEPDNDNFVAPGYKVVSETQANGDIWYTVVAE